MKRHVYRRMGGWRLFGEQTFRLTKHGVVFIHRLVEWSVQRERVKAV